MHVFRTMLLLCLTAALTISAPAQDEEKEKIDLEKGPGIKVGSELPEIKLLDQSGKEVSIHKMLESGNVALVFFRSADW